MYSALLSVMINMFIYFLKTGEMHKQAAHLFVQFQPPKPHSSLHTPFVHLWLQASASANVLQKWSSSQVKTFIVILPMHVTIHFNHYTTVLQHSSRTLVLHPVQSCNKVATNIKHSTYFLALKVIQWFCWKCLVTKKHNALTVANGIQEDVWLDVSQFVPFYEGRLLFSMFIKRNKLKLSLCPKYHLSKITTVSRYSFYNILPYIYYTTLFQVP